MGQGERGGEMKGRPWALKNKENQNTQNAMISHERNIRDCKQEKEEYQDIISNEF